MKGGKDKSMEGIRMYKEKQKVGFGMNYTQSRELKEKTGSIGRWRVSTMKYV